MLLSLTILWVMLRALQEFHSTTHATTMVAWFKTGAPPADASSNWELTGCLLCSPLSHKLLPYVCNLCLTLVAAGMVSSNKPGIVERQKYVWVTPFGDAPLLMIQITYIIPTHIHMHTYIQIDGYTYTFLGLHLFCVWKTLQRMKSKKYYMPCF